MAEQTEYATAAEVRELQEQVKSLLQERDRESNEKEQKMIRLEQELETLKNDQSASLDVPPYDFTVTNYKYLTSNSGTWKIDSFYTHPGGYKFHIQVYPHTMAVYLYPEPGEYDDTLPWPARVSITIELRNQYREQDHMEITSRLEWGHKDTNRRYISDCFLPHDELKWNDTHQTQFMRNNCLRFRITKILVRKK